MFEIAPSILSADFTRLADEIERVRSGGAKVLHVDVMDGHFVPNITIGLPVVKSIRKATDIVIDTHLMISEPGRYAVEFVNAGANMVSVHVEADDHLQRTLTAIREAGAQAGIAINPGTPLEMLSEALPYADFVLLMDCLRFCRDYVGTELVSVSTALDIVGAEKQGAMTVVGVWA